MITVFAQTFRCINTFCCRTSEWMDCLAKEFNRSDRCFKKKKKRKKKSQLFFCSDWVSSAGNNHILHKQDYILTIPGKHNHDGQQQTTKWKPTNFSTLLTSTRVFPGTGTGALSSRRIQVSISRTSCMTSVEMLSLVWPVRTPHTVSLQNQKAWTTFESFDQYCERFNRSNKVSK